MIPQIIEYLILQGQLTGTSENAEVENNGNSTYIIKWNFPEQQPDFAAIEATQGFQDYLNDREIFIQRKQAKEFIEKELKRFSLVVLDEINITRKWTRDYKTEVAAATSLSDLKTRVAAMDTLGDRTITQLKNAMDLKD